MQRELSALFSIFFLSCLGILTIPGCAKEYSYEGGATDAPIPDTVIARDSATQSGPVLPPCISCLNNNNTTGFYWNFKLETSSLCGYITNAVITPDRDGFTFFGPSECSLDSGLIMTVLLDSTTALNRDRGNVTTNRASLEYYDNTTLTDVFISKRPSLSFTIDRYEHATGIAKGSFLGTVTLKDSSKRMVTAGRFVIQFK